MNLNSKICALLNINYPILQAGMAGGITKPELVAAVSNAGGLGVIGAGYLTPEAMKDAIHTVRKLTDKPFAVNIFKVDLAPSDNRTGEVHEKYLPFYEGLHIHPSAESITSSDYYEEQFKRLVEEKVSIITTTFGVPSEYEIRLAHANGIKIITMITTVQEAIHAEKAGVDILVAQGSEAGGHRGTFDLSGDSQGALIGTMALVPQVVDHVHIPVIAAGGIMDGRGLVAALALGAQGVQLGSRFLHAIESGTDDTYKSVLLKSAEDSTTITNCFTGRPARAIKNEFIDFHLQHSIKPLAYPIQNQVTNPIRMASRQHGKHEYMSLWAGQGLRLSKEGQTAEEILKEIMGEAKKILDKS